MYYKTLMTRYRGNHARSFRDVRNYVGLVVVKAVYDVMFFAVKLKCSSLA